ncbi:MAG: T9SS type A sorting domain-containing protein, partial [Chitinophagaceae bacterium]|nr:T9SS type A sorting domain-containing protein [Chitinophagaceae bacterium]
YPQSANFATIPVLHIHGDKDPGSDNGGADYPDPDFTPNYEWPLSYFSEFTCGAETYNTASESWVTQGATTFTNQIQKIPFCTGDVPITLIRIVGGGHNWPNVPNFNTAQYIWDFFNNNQNPFQRPDEGSCTAPTPQPTPSNSNFIHTFGSNILSACGNQLILKGINYAPYNWGSDPNSIEIGEIAKTGANAIRLVWSKNPSYFSGSYSSIYDITKPAGLNYLDALLKQCADNNIIAIPELHDNTAGNGIAVDNNYANLISTANWWIDPDVLNILNKYKNNIIVNIANEALLVDDDGNPTTNLNGYVETYKTIITNLRTGGCNFPLMIDAPDYGQNPSVFGRIYSNNESVAKTLNDADPLHNLIFSVHPYWDNQDGFPNAASITNTFDNNLKNLGYPAVLGEVGAYHEYSKRNIAAVDYSTMLQYCQNNQMGYLIWEWDNDSYYGFEMSNDGTYNNLTSFGNDIVNNPDYGMKTKPVAMNKCIVTPITLLSFTAEAQTNNTVLLQWATATETNNKGFSIQRSADGANWTDLSFVNSMATGGNSSVQNNYQYTDNNPFAGENYYRLKQIDLNNAANYSAVQQLNFNKQATALQVLPNPASGDVRVTLTGAGGNVRYRLISMNGSVILSGTMNNADGYGRISVSNVATGLYFLQIITNNTVQSCKLMVTH